MVARVSRERNLQLLFGFWTAVQGDVSPAKTLAAAEDAAGAGQGGNPDTPAGRPADVPEGDEMDESGEIAPPALVRAPEGPSRAEVAEHEATGHVQYRNWCRHCLAGRGLGQQHRSRPDTACSFYRKQVEAGRFFLHEAPWSAASWKDPEVRDLSERPDVYTVRGPMCRWVVATDRRGLQGTGYVRKETGWMTNHPGLAQLLQGECTNKTAGQPWHRHVHLIGELARPLPDIRQHYCRRC